MELVRQLYFREQSAKTKLTVKSYYRKANHRFNDLRKRKLLYEAIRKWSEGNSSVGSGIHTFTKKHWVPTRVRRFEKLSWLEL